MSEPSLVAQIQAYSDYLKTHEDIVPSDLAWTLQSRRSQFPFKAAFSATTIEQLTSKMDAKLAEVKQNSAVNIGIRSNAKVGASSHILGVFTGQGAQWPAMGAELIRSSDYVRERIQDLEESLATLPSADRPQWSLQEEMVAGADTSRIAEAALSQPLCTAVQIILVDLLKAAGITFSAVVGHSSGEIGAAYAAGLVSDHDAIRIAYYRGLYARLAGSASSGIMQKGAMIAMGTSWEDAQDLARLSAFRGRLAIAAHNSPASVTLSGDADAIVHAKKVFDEEKKFARLLKVDTAYHSHHMLPCGEPYVDSMRACGIRVNRDRSTSCSWFSSVNPSSKPMEPTEDLQDVYWRDNMTNAVLFADAVHNAVASDPQINLVLEVGPHPALKGPATQIISDLRPTPLPYCGVLNRGANDVEAFADALGFVWTHLTSQGVNFESLEKIVSVAPSPRQPKLVVGLPSYQWNHTRRHWHESRKSRRTRSRKQPFHELLGFPNADSTPRDLRWSNLLKPSEIPWLDGHRLQGQTVFPAAGYVAMALEAARHVAAQTSKSVELFELQNLAIPRAITFEEDDNSGVETLVTLTGVRSEGKDITLADFSCYSCPSINTGSEQEMDLAASGTVRIVYGTRDIEALPCTPLDVSNMSKVDVDRFYASLVGLGYGYAGHFTGMSSLKRKLNRSSVFVDTYPYADDDAVYLVHPTYLDVAFQASMLAYSAPGDGRLWSLHVPTSIGSIRVNPEVCASLPMSGSKVLVCSELLDESESLAASIDIFGHDGEHGMIQIEDLIIKPFAQATEADDHRLYSHTKWEYAVPDGASVICDSRTTPHEVELVSACERLSYYYLRKWKLEITEDDWANAQPHYKYLRNYMEQTLLSTSRGQQPSLRKEWAEDSDEDIKALLLQYGHHIDIKLIRASGENIPTAVRGQTPILEHLFANNMLDDYYKQGVGFAKYNSFLGRLMKQVTHRYPHARVLEIGAGTGGATKSVLESIGDTMSSYTYTDVSVGFFNKAAALFKAHVDKLIFKVLDIEKPLAAQGFEPHAYDIVVASNVLHATESLQTTLESTRQLLKPGGYLMLLEVTNNGPIRFSNIMGGVSGWWLGAHHDGRTLAPTTTPEVWHATLRKAGFAGIDTITPEIDGMTWPLSVMVAQAVDDRVSFLRRPLSSSSASSIYLDSVVILGTGSLESSRIAEGVAEYLGRFCGQITILDGLPTEAEAATLSPLSTFVNLVDIASPIFKDITAEKMDGLKRILELAKHILWITIGSRADQPYHSASLAFCRAMSHEATHISLSLFDISLKDLGHNGDVSKFIAEHLLRQSALDEWQSPRDKTMLWSKEPEVFLDGGRLTIPRLVPNPTQNARLNATRRVVTKELPVSGSKLSILPPASESLPPCVVEQVLPMASKASKPIVRTESSSLMALHIAADTFLYLIIGKDNATSHSVVAFSATNSSEVTPIASTAAYDADTDDSRNADGLLIGVTSELLAASLVDTLTPGGSILVHCSSRDSSFAASLSRQAADKRIRVSFTCDESDEDMPQEFPGLTWIRLNARKPKHVVRKLLPTKVTHFLDLTSRKSDPSSSDLSRNIASALSSGYKRIDPSDLSRYESLVSLSSCDREALTVRLQDAVSRARTMITVMSLATTSVVPLGQIHVQPTRSYTTMAVQWPSDGLIKVQVRPLEVQRLFSQDKSYLLVGLSGQIGQSLAEWMVANGAGCVCLTSRNPKVNDKWLQSFPGAVKVFSLDITDRNSLEGAVKEIRATCPPIAGVANGAMVLHDMMFQGMPVEVMQKGLRPKVDGSNYLDELFHDEPLDFFILLSSLACVVGNSGQSNYVVANGYLNGLARQRRKRGLAASAVDIGRVAGLGYVETAGQVVVDQLTRFGFLPISESEFHHIFAETIRAGYPDPEKDKEGIPDAVVTTGIRTIRDDEGDQIARGPWVDNPFLSHCLVETKSAAAEAGQQNKKSALAVGEQVSKAATKEEALDVLQGTPFYQLSDEIVRTRLTDYVI